MIKYFKGLFNGIWSLLKGMKVTGLYFFRPSTIITQQYPENRAELKMFDRTKCELIMPHDQNNQHKCTGCGICEIYCPNGSIVIKALTTELPDGKKKKSLDIYTYNLGMCTFCELCVKSCPSNAIEFTNEFELAVFDRNRLIKQLNKPGSTLITKED